MCTYKLEGECKLKFNMLFTMDGNNSLKRILQHGPPTEEAENIPGPVLECLDFHILTTDYYIPREDVEKWGGDVKQEMIPTQTKKVHILSECPICN
jgi:hypothetical protein